MSEYYKLIREQVGLELLMIPSVAAIIRNDKDEILFIRKEGETAWGLPAGAIEPGETPSRALRREIFEETGLMVNPSTIAGVFGGDKYKFKYSNDHEVEYLVVVFECTIVKGSLRGLDGEAQELKFFGEHDIPELAIPYPREIFSKLNVKAAMFE